MWLFRAQTLCVVRLVAAWVVVAGFVTVLVRGRSADVVDVAGFTRRRWVAVVDSASTCVADLAETANTSSQPCNGNWVYSYVRVPKWSQQKYGTTVWRVCQQIHHRRHHHHRLSSACLIDALKLDKEGKLTVSVAVGSVYSRHVHKRIKFAPAYSSVLKIIHLWL